MLIINTMDTTNSLFSSPRWMVLQLTEKCNLRCKMCYEWGESGSYFEKDTLAMLDFEVAKKVINEVAPFKPYYDLFGGEPLMYPKIGELISLIREKGSDVDFPTNGVLIAKEAEMLVETQPTRLWVSLDGPPSINDAQRGRGVFKRAVRGIEKLYELRGSKQQVFPKIGITYIVTPENYQYIEEFFLENIDLSMLDHLSIEMQTYSTHEQHHSYSQIMKEHFDGASSSCAGGYVQDPSIFRDIDYEAVVQQIHKVREIFEAQNGYFIVYPKTVETENLRHYFSARWDKMKDYKKRCLFPWHYAEISAGGDVTTCHSFYDYSLGNIHEQGILEIWNGEKIKKVRNYLKKQLYPICTSCMRYYADPQKQ